MVQTEAGLLVLKRTSAWSVAIALAVVGLLVFSSLAQAANPWAERLTGYMDARDGMDLKYSVLLPPGDGPFPAIMNYSGYDPGSIGGTAYQAGNTTMDPELDAKLLKAGYAVVGVNMRGTGCSDGNFSLFANEWGTDGYDAVEWTADQPWSNGKVGMANWS
ncbi:MAG: CocE/NonD family hydrolase, partial [Solirubrobacterales bacterium]|nr:CocE/NonD family hydrolase [Solirubrobacterales bacterium]